MKYTENVPDLTPFREMPFTMFGALGLCLGVFLMIAEGVYNLMTSAYIAGTLPLGTTALPLVVFGLFSMIVGLVIRRKKGDDE